MVYDNPAQMASGKRRLAQLGIKAWRNRIR